MRTLTIRPIKTEADNNEALERIAILLNTASTEGENDELNVLSILVEDFESRHYQSEAPDPISAIEFRMDQLGLKPTDIVPIIGDAFVVAEVLERRKKLTLPMIRNLHNSLKIPISSLINDYDLVETTEDAS